MPIKISSVCPLRRWIKRSFERKVRHKKAAFMRGFLGDFSNVLSATHFTVDKQHHQRTDHGDNEAAEVETVYAAKTKERTDITPDHGTDNPQNHGQDKPAAIFTRHDPFRQNTCN